MARGPTGGSLWLVERRTLMLPLCELPSDQRPRPPVDERDCSECLGGAGMRGMMVSGAWDAMRSSLRDGGGTSG